MEQLERNKFTAAGEIVNERLVEAASDPDRYPGALALLEHWMTRRREAKSGGVPSTPLPADYQVEIREPLVVG